MGEPPSLAGAAHLSVALLLSQSFAAGLPGLSGSSKQNQTYFLRFPFDSIPHLEFSIFEGS